MTMATQVTRKIPNGYKQTELGVIPEDWEVRHLNQLVEFTNGKAHESSIKDDGKYIVANSKFVSTEGEVRKYSDNCFCPTTTGNILLVMSDVPNGKAIAKCFFVDKNDCYTVNQRICSLRAKVGDPRFLSYVINRNRYYLSFDDGVKQTNLRKDDVLGCPIPLPPTKAEQAAIAEALSDADALISRLEQLIAKKRNIKQGAMQELLTGKKRLPGFSGEWEVRKLGEIADRFVNGGTPSTKNEDYWAGNIPWITGADILNQRVSAIRRHITEIAVKNSSTNVIEKGNLLLVSRTGVGKLAIAPFDVAVSQDFTGIYVNKTELLTEYLYRYFGFNQSLLQSQNQGTSIQGITRDTLSDIPILLPPLPEQTAIAQILSDMDAEIEQLEQKLDKYRMIKQGMMQELLTGKTRLV